MFKRANIAVLAVMVAAGTFLSGCGLFNKAKEKLDPPKEVSQLKDGEKLDEAAGEKDLKETNAEEQSETVLRDLYLIDRNGMVVSQTLPLPKSESAAKQALEYLVADGPVTEILPNGFRTVLPAGTTVDVDIKDGKAVVDFSEEFGSYDAKDEKSILEAVTWTLTQFESVKYVELRVNGHTLSEMPVDGTPINDGGLSRDDGINMSDSGVADITNTKPLTVYYISQGEGDSSYYVPVTRRISNEEVDEVSAVVNELIEGPGMSASLVSALSGDAELLEAPKVEDGVATLNFNEAVLGDGDQKMVSNEALQSLVLSLTEQKGIKSVSVMVDGKAELVNESGEPLTEPVSRPEKINAKSY